MNPILAAAQQVDDLCRGLSLRYCFIGGLAVLRWGEPRLTRDVDLTVVTEFGAEEPVDVALGALPFEERTTQRASPWTIRPGVELLTCSAEDLVVHKAFAGRDRDWLDIEGVVTRQGPRLDRGLITDELLPLLELKEAAHQMGRLQEILDRDRRP